MISKKAKAIFKAIDMINYKEKMRFDEPRRTKLNYIPLKVYIKNDITQMEICGRNVYKIVPKDTDPKNHIVYFHGGGYANESSINHFLTVNKLIEISGFRVSFVEYPLIPEANVHQTLAMVIETYEHLIETYPDHLFTLMGDSAGGGLALALALIIKEKRLKLPDSIVMYSPWLDVSMSNPHIPEYDLKDVILNLEAMDEAADLYAHDLSKTDPRVSPIYGDLTGLGRILMFYGTDEVLKPDCDRLCELAPLEGTDITCLLYEEMQHDWVLMPIPEQETALEETVRFILGM